MGLTFIQITNGICPEFSDTLKSSKQGSKTKKQLGDKLQCVCYIVGNSFMYSGVRRALSTRCAQLLEKQAQRIISAR